MLLQRKSGKGRKEVLPRGSLAGLGRESAGTYKARPTSSCLWSHHRTQHCDTKSARLWNLLGQRGSVGMPHTETEHAAGGQRLLWPTDSWQLPDRGKKVGPGVEGLHGRPWPWGRTWEGRRDSGATFWKWRQSLPTLRGLWNPVGGFGDKEVPGGSKAHPQGALWPMATWRHSG